MALTAEDRSEIVFFDLETTVPKFPGQGRAILEFGAILVCPRKLVELRSYSTLIRPGDLSHISSLSVRSSGISKDAVVSAPSFADIADVVYDLLHGRIWAGHNILRFDCVRIRAAFAEINRPAPEPKGTIDSLALLTKKFGRRAGDMKMSTLAMYFGLGKQTHRSLDDVRMNLEVLKYCATVLFLESSLSSSAQNENMASSSAIAGFNPELYPLHHVVEENHPTQAHMSEGKLPLTEPNPARANIFDFSGLVEKMKEPLPDDGMEEEADGSTAQESLASLSYKNSNGFNYFLEPHNVSVPSISVVLVPFYPLPRIKIRYQNLPLQLQCAPLKVRFGISKKFFDHVGRPRLSFVVDAPPSLHKILDEIDSLAQKLSVDSGSSSKWHYVVTRKQGFPTVRLRLPTVTDGERATEIYQKDSSATQKLVFSRFDAAELDSLIAPGNVVDAYFSLDAYDYKQNAGIRLVTKKMIIHSCSDIYV